MYNGVSKSWKHLPWGYLLVLLLFISNKTRNKENLEHIEWKQYYKKMNGWMNVYVWIYTRKLIPEKENNTSETHEHNIVRNLSTFHTSFIVCVKYPELLLE